MKVIVSGGGTAGHIYPALSVAHELRERGAELLFVGAVGKMEMERVPKEGFRIVGLPIVGIRRSFRPSAIIHNLRVPFLMLRSSRKARRVIRDFSPDVVVGFGGYASAPVLRAAQRLKIPTVIQEQNSYAGLTNRLLGRGAEKICVAYGGMDRFFATDKIVHTGNPIKASLACLPSREDAAGDFGLSATLPTILVTGGSLGTRTLNEMVFEYLGRDYGKEIQIIWQCGRIYYEEFKQRVADLGERRGVRFVLVPFIERMSSAYALSDIVICRAGASTVSELQLVGLPALFVPSPNVAEDHQTANAMAVVRGGGAEMVADSDAVERAMDIALDLFARDSTLGMMSQRIKTMAKPNATRDVADIVEGVVVRRRDDRVYFVGIGGIGMSALARFFKSSGYSVAGYDRVRTELCQRLESEGIEIHYEDNVEFIPKLFRDREHTKVVYTPAVPSTHGELQWFRARGFEVIKRAQSLGLLSKGRYTMAVAGTHGKSSTATMVAWLNHVASTDGTGSAFLGAISKNFGSNAIIGSGDRVVVEADEFDRSFHSLSPQVALITAADPDHLDIYGTEEAFVEAFEIFIEKCSDGVITRHGLNLSVPSNIKHFTYSVDSPKADYYARNVTLGEDGLNSFDVVTPGGEVIEGCRLGVPGLINLENAIGAIALVDQRGFDTERLREALESFRGIERRFDLWYSSPTAVYMDDYAHHPTELNALIESMRQAYAGRHLTVCFQPHLYSRTRDFAQGFADALSLADRVVMLPIYPAREEPIEGVSSEIIADGMRCERYLIEMSELEGLLAKLPTDVVVTAGAGDIDTLRQGVFEVIKAKEDE